MDLTLPGKITVQWKMGPWKWKVTILSLVSKRAMFNWTMIVARKVAEVNKIPQSKTLSFHTSCEFWVMQFSPWNSPMSHVSPMSPSRHMEFFLASWKGDNRRSMFPTSQLETNLKHHCLSSSNFKIAKSLNLTHAWKLQNSYSRCCVGQSLAASRSASSKAHLGWAT